LGSFRGKDFRENRSKIFAAVVDHFVVDQDYGGKVLANARSTTLWLIPVLLILFALTLLLFGGYKWVQRGKKRLAASGGQVVDVEENLSEDEERWRDQLDDELRETD